MARAGMSTLIRRLRQMTEAGQEDYTLDGVTYWGDDDLQAVLDESRLRHTDVLLDMKPDYVSANDIYLRYGLPWSIGNAVEGTAGGTAVFRIHDSDGTTIAFSGFTFNERSLEVEFTTDQEGSARYWDGYGFDLEAAARGIWLTKAGHMHKAIDFSADGARFDREAIYQHCIDMAKVFGYREAGGKVRLSRMVRSDLQGVGGDAF